MTPDQIETLSANAVLATISHALRYAESGDVNATSVAVLVRAVELCTPDISAANRAQLFTGDE